MPGKYEELSEERQKLLLTLLGCGLSCREVQDVCGINSSTARKHREEFIFNGLLPEYIDPTTKYARVWHALKDGVVAKPTRSRLHQLIIKPFEANYLVLAPPIYLSPKTPFERLWEKTFGSDEERIWAKIHTVVQGMMSPVYQGDERRLYPSETAIFTALADEFHSTDHLPDWHSCTEAILSSLKELSKRERVVIESHFGLKGEAVSTLEAIGEKLDVTRERVRQIELGVFRKIRYFVKRYGLELGTIGEFWAKSHSAREIIKKQQAKTISLKCQERSVMRLVQCLNTTLSKLREVLVSGVPEMTHIPETPISELEFSQRAFNCLRRAGLLTLRDLAAASESDLFRIRGFGKKTFSEVRDKLEEHGLELKAPAGSYDVTDEEDGYQ